MENSEDKILLSNTKPKIKSKKNKYKSLKSKTKKEKEIEKQRYYIFDNFKGLLIFTVVFAHFLWEYVRSHNNKLARKLVIFIYYFHMPGFIFISGFLTSDNSSKISNSFRLLILYYIFNFSFNIIMHKYFNTRMDLINPQLSYWYLLSLFFWRISIKYINKIKISFITSMIISLLEGYSKFFTNAFSLIRTVAYLPFFIAGYKIAKTQIFDKFLLWRKHLFKYVCFIIPFIFFIYRLNIYIDKNMHKIVNETLIMFGYDNNNTIKARIIFFMARFNLSLSTVFK